HRRRLTFVRFDVPRRGPELPALARAPIQRKDQPCLRRPIPLASSPRARIGEISTTARRCRFGSGWAAPRLATPHTPTLYSFSSSLPSWDSFLSPIPSSSPSTIRTY